MFQHLTQWFNQLARRERYILWLGTLVSIGLLGYAWLWKPWVKAYTDLDNKVAAQQVTLRWMQQAAQDIQQLRGQPSNSSASSNSAVSLLTVIDNSRSQELLKTTPKRVEPKGEEEILVEFEEVSFTALMQWLLELYNRYQVQVSAINIERQSSPDQVKVRVTLSKR